MKQLIPILLLTFILADPMLMAQTPPNAEPPHQDYSLGQQREQPILLSESQEDLHALLYDFKRDKQWKSSQVFLRLSAMPAPYHFRINHFLFSTVSDASLPVEFNITPFLREENNRVELQFDSTMTGQEAMQCSSGALVIRESLHVRDIRVSTHHTKKTSESMVRVQVFLQSFVERDKRHRTLTMTISDSAENKVFSDRQSMDFPLAYRQETEFSFDHSMEDPILWSPDHPYLYQVEIQLLEKGMFLGELLETSFGICTASYQDSTLLINGDTIVPLKVGNEVLSQLRCMDELQRTELLENQSFNTICSPGPLPEDFLSFCDRKGIIVLQYSPLARTANSSLSMHPCLILTEEQD
jgi:beta-galactosidase/beta-glucuronidase